MADSAPSCVGTDPVSAFVERSKPETRPVQRPSSEGEAKQCSGTMKVRGGGKQFVSGCFQIKTKRKMMPRILHTARKRAADASVAV